MDKYQQHEHLGQGNNSVYRATRLSDGVDVALKRVKGWAGLEAADQEVALREVAVLRTLKHPHTITLLDSYSDGGDLCLVLPLVRPGSRAFEGAALPLSPHAVERVGFQLASALAYLHGLQPQLLHRDIKPANLLLAAAPGSVLPPPGPLTPAQASALFEGGSMLLSDFGSALAMRKTLATGTVSGTPAYKASEILREEEYAAPADVWALGVTLLQLATGHVVGGTSAARRALMGLSGRPWTLQQALEGLYHDKSPSPAEEVRSGEACAAHRAAWETLGPDLQDVIGKCLVVQAEQRAQAGELLQHPAFHREHRAEKLLGAVARLQKRQQPEADELLAVLEAGAGVEKEVFERACRLVEGVSVDEAGEALCSALRGALGGGERVRPAAHALMVLHRKGCSHALLEAQAAAEVLLEQVASGEEAERRSVAMAAQLQAERAEMEALKAQLRASAAQVAALNAKLKASADLIDKKMSLVAEMARQIALKEHLAGLVAENSRQKEESCLKMASAAEQACLALRKIAADSAGQDVCFKAGAVNALVAELRAHPSVAAVAENACGALGKIAQISAGQEACVATDAASSIVAALQAHRSVAVVAEAACMALSSIAYTRAGHEACKAANALPAIVAALQDHLSVAAVSREACKALINLTCASSTSIQASLSAGALKTLQTASLTLIGSDFSGIVCWALCNIDLAASAKSNLATSAVSDITSNMRAGGTPYFTMLRCWSLANIASTETGKGCCIAGGAVPLLAAAFKGHTGDTRQQAHNALVKLGYIDDGSKI